jgi:hypothetical protein
VLPRSPGAALPFRGEVRRVRGGSARRESGGNPLGGNPGAQQRWIICFHRGRIRLLEKTCVRCPWRRTYERGSARKVIDSCHCGGSNRMFRGEKVFGQLETVDKIGASSGDREDGFEN